MKEINIALYKLLLYFAEALSFVKREKSWKCGGIFIKSKEIYESS